MQSFSNLYYLSKSYITYVIDYYSQKKFFKNYKPIQELLYKSRYNLRGYELYRLKDYSVRLFALLGGALKYLEDYELTYSERCKLTILGAFAPLYDDFIDHTLAKIAKLKIFVKDPNYYMPLNLKEKTGHELLKLLLNYYEGNIKKIFPIGLKTHFIQIQSQKQKEDNISRKELAAIIRYKGGYSSLLCRYMLDLPLRKNEYELWFQYGAFLQLLDDLYDMKKDFDNGIKTIANTSNTLNELHIFLDSEFNNLKNNLNKTSFKTNNKNKFMFRVALVYIAGKGLLYQLNKKVKKTNNIIDLKRLKRKHFNLRYFSPCIFLYMIKLACKLKLD